MAAAMSAAAGRIAEEGVTAGDLLNALSGAVRCPDHGLAVSATAAILFPQAARVEAVTAGGGPLKAAAMSACPGVTTSMMTTWMGAFMCRGHLLRLLAAGCRQHVVAVAAETPT